MEIGPFRLDVVNDGIFWLDGGTMFGVVPKALWSRLIEPDERNRIPMATNCLLVRGPAGTFLVETGLGDQYSEKQHRIYSFEFGERLLGGLGALGVSPEDVDMVVQTHLHFDHCGTLVRRSAGGRYAPTFPRAEVVVQRAEWEAALEPDSRSRPSYFPFEYYAAVEKAGMLRLLDGETALAPGLTARPLSGHTSGHQVVEITAGREKAVYLGDFIPQSNHVALPYIMSFDLFPLKTLEDKAEFLPLAIRGGWTVVFEHDPHVPFATLHEENGRPVARPLGEE